MNYLVERVPVRDATTKFRQVNDSDGGLGDVNGAVQLDPSVPIVYLPICHDPSIGTTQWLVPTT